MDPAEEGGRLRGRVALVTGASRLRAIGAATCRTLAAAGADIALSHWRPYDAAFPWVGAADEPVRLAADLRRMGVRAEEIEADLADPDVPERLLDEAIRRLGPLSILVNNAAYSTQEGFETLDAASLDAHYAVNLRGMALLSVGFARRYQGEHGRIINLTSGQS